MSKDNTPETEDEWRETLTDEEYKILRERGTEPRFTGEHLNKNQDGEYKCSGCGSTLFHTSDQFDAGHGWPSFKDAVESDNIETEVDTRGGRERTEALCAECGGHLGHIFPDGPEPTGKRYCINSAALDFDEDE